MRVAGSARSIVAVGALRPAMISSVHGLRADSARHYPAAAGLGRLTDDEIREQGSLIFCIPIQHLVVHLPLEKQVHIAFPSKANTTMKLYGSTAAEDCHVAGFRFCHSRQTEGFSGVVIDRAGGVVGQRFGIVDLQHDIDEGMLHRLKEP